jgi:hypothetical protein
MWDQLNLKAIELEKNLKKCEAVSDAGIKITSKSSRLVAALQQLSDTQESSEDLKNKANFVLKFKKFPNTKEPLDVINGQALTASIEAQTEDLLGDCRSCKAHSSAR